MRNKSFDSIVGKLELMVSALRRNAGEVAKYSVSAAEIDGAAARIGGIKDENARQERLKSDLKESTEKIEAALSEAEADYSRYKKIVKLAFPQARWKEFGLDDKK